MQLFFSAFPKLLKIDGKATSVLVSECTLQSDAQVGKFTVGYASSGSQRIGQVHLETLPTKDDLKIIFTP